MAEKSIIGELEGKVASLLSDHQRVSALCTSLQEQKEKLLVERRTLQEQVASLSSELSALRISSALGGAKEQTKAERDKSRARINHLLREVDKCIALLNGGTDQQSAQ